MLLCQFLRLGASAVKSSSIFKEPFLCCSCSFGTIPSSRLPAKHEAPTRVVHGDWDALPKVVKTWVTTQVRITG